MAPPRSVPLSGCLSFLLLPLIFLCVDGSDVRVHISGLPSSSVTTSPSALSLPVTAAPLASNENGDATRPLLTLTLRLQPSVQHESYLRLHLPHTGQTRRVDSADNARCAFYAGTARLKHTYAQTLALQLPRRPPRTKTDAGANAGPNSAGPDPTPDVLQSATVTLALCNGEVRAVMYLDAVQGAALVLLPLSETGSHTLRLEVPPQVMTEAESTAPLSGPSLRLRQPATAGASSLPLPSVSVPRASTCGAVHPRRGPLAAGAVASRSRIRRASSLECASRPTKTVSLVVVSDAKHLAQHGGDGAAAALDALAAVHATQSLLADAAFDCSIALRVVGHVVFESAADLRLPVRACNTVDPLFANALPMSDPCCAWLESNGPTPTPTGCGTKVYCLADAGGQEATTAACFTKSIAYGTLEDSSGTLVLEAEQFSITGVTSTRADEVEGFGLLSYLSEQATAVPAASDTLRTLFSEHGVDVDHFLLLSGGDFAGSLRGLAYVGGMCGGGQSSSINMADLGTLAAATVATMAHELGHSLGMIHDTDSCSKTDCAYIMAPNVVTATTLEWSPAAVSALHAWMDDTYPSRQCLEDAPPADAFQAVCGDGIIELNEECDPGGNANLDSCCDAATCRLVAGAVCSSLEPCCTSSCTLQSAGTSCRAALGSCDVAETCSGTDASCPSDITLANGDACKTGVPTFSDGLCSGGACLNPDAWCFERYGESVTLDGTLRAHRDTNNECADFWCLFRQDDNTLAFRREAGVPHGVSCNVNTGLCRDRACVTNSADWPVPQLTVTGWSACVDGTQALLTTCTDETGSALAASVCDAIPNALSNRTRSCDVAAATTSTTTLTTTTTTITTTTSTTTTTAVNAIATTTTTNAPTENASDGSEGLGSDGAVILGAVLGSIAVVALVAGVLLFYKRSNPKMTLRPHPSVLGRRMPVVNGAFSPRGYTG